ncbi:cadherin repeat domain-containing protein [Novosphingobium sp. KCTC 2891]|uniref:cadherin repeat domain-containing protein n=1 Tax=Novosphingobium sp. KCTC 2891 TaxID=2989730 RepID=UPI002223906A|nr:cadherin repeat domain-containing protein [Novosphingobium sp. KCTC 2891]
MIKVGAVGGDFLVNTQIASDQIEPAITGLANGGFVATWTDYSGTLGDTSVAGVKAQVVDTWGEKVGTEFRVNTQVDAAQFDPAVTKLHDGGFTIAWTDRSATLGDASATSIKAQVFSVTDTNQAPVITSDGGGAKAKLSVAEYATAVTTVRAADADAGTKLTYFIGGGADGDLFTINSVTGQLSFKSAPVFEAPGDAGANNIYDVIVSASDGAITDSQAIAVTVTNVALTAADFIL